MRGAWDLIVACKGSVVVAWRRGRVRTGLVVVLAAAVMVGAVGALWLVAGGNGAGHEAAAPADRTATTERQRSDDDPVGRERDDASEPLRRGSPGRAWRTEAMAKAAALSGAPADGSRMPSSTSGNGDSGPASQPAGAATSGPPRAPTASPQRGGSPKASTPVTTSSGPPESPAGRTTPTTTTPRPPPDSSGAGGLLGGLLDVLGLG